MEQALHIFKKDVRYLRGEIALVAVISLLFAWIQSRTSSSSLGSPYPPVMSMLLTIATGYLLVRLIHAEAIPGDNQFWITRPYEWKNLAGAKLLFVLVFINGPICLAQLLIVMLAGFPIVPSFPGLLWSQVLIFLCASLPIAALAAMTAGIVPLIFLVLILGAFGMLAAENVAAVYRVTTYWPLAVDWIRYSLVVVALCAIAAAVLYVQYKSRRTRFSRMFAMVSLLVTAVLYLFLPMSWEVLAESWLYPQSSETSGIQISAGPAVLHRFRFDKNIVFVSLDISGVYSGLPDGYSVNTDVLKYTLQRADGQTWGDTQVMTIQGKGMRTDGTFKSGVGIANPSFFAQLSDQPFTIRGTMYATLFNKESSHRIPLSKDPVNAMDGLQCYKADYDNFTCRSLFRWPRTLINERNELGTTSLWDWISYSPFPADMNLNPIEVHATGAPPESATEAAIVTREPIAHFHRDFEIRDVHLTDPVDPRVSRKP